jgi:hypothetical protein
MRACVFTLFILIYNLEVYSCAKETLKSLAAPAINSILVEYFAKTAAKVDLIYFGSKATKSDKIFDEVLRNKSDLITFQVSMDGVQNPWKRKLNFSSVLIFNRRKYSARSLAI